MNKKIRNPFEHAKSIDEERTIWTEQSDKSVPTTKEEFINKVKKVRSNKK